jgi:uncharacterized protein YkwD
VHHHPAGPPLTARLRGSGTRWLLLARRALHRRSGRLGLAALLTAAAAIVLSVPMTAEPSGRAPSAGLDASASSSSARESDSGPPVVMGRDGAPTTPSDSAGPGPSAAGSPSALGTGATAAGTTADRSDPVTSDVPPSSAGSPATTVSSMPTAQTPTPTATAAGVTDPGDEETVLDLVNAARAEEGCAALVPDAALTDRARTHSTDMRDAGALTLLTPDGGPLLELGGRAATVAHGPSDPTAVVQEWLSNPDARATLLDCGLSAAGVGVTQGSDGAWWTQLLG